MNTYNPEKDHMIARDKSFQILKECIPCRRILPIFWITLIPSCPWQMANGKWEYDMSTPLLRSMYSLLLLSPGDTVSGSKVQSVLGRRAAIPLHFHSNSSSNSKPKSPGYGQAPSPYPYHFRADSLFPVRGFPVISLSAL